MRVEQGREGEGLRRLHGAQLGAIERAGDAAGGIDALDRVGDRERGNRRAGIAAAAIARDTRPAEQNGRAASCTSTMSGE